MWWITRLRKESRRRGDGAALCCSSESELKERDAHFQNIVRCSRARLGARCGPAPGSQSGTSCFSPHRSAAVQRKRRSADERSAADTGVFFDSRRSKERTRHVPCDVLAFGLFFQRVLIFGEDKGEGGTGGRRERCGELSLPVDDDVP